MEKKMEKKNDGVLISKAALAAFIAALALLAAAEAASVLICRARLGKQRARDADFKRVVVVEPFRDEGCATIDGSGRSSLVLSGAGSKGQFLCYVRERGGGVVPADICWKYLFGGDETLSAFKISSKRFKDKKTLVTVEAGGEVSSNILMLYSPSGSDVVANVLVSVDLPGGRARLEEEIERMREFQERQQR